MMILGLSSLLGVGMGYYTFLRVRGELAMAYSALTLIAILHVCGYTCGLSAGTWAFCLLSIAGLTAFIIVGGNRGGFFSFGVVALAVMFVVMLFAFHGDFIQTYDDFHQWAAEAKYMLQHNYIPTGSDFVGVASVPPESSLFAAFFQILGGYNEGHMYTSSFLFTAMAVVIPLIYIRWKDWYKGLLYIILVYAGFFSLYNQPYKSMYVDLPAAVWAGSTCILWSALNDMAGREELSFRKRCMMVLPILIFVTRIKWGVSILMWVFTLGYILVDILSVIPTERVRSFWNRRWIYIVGIFAAIVFMMSAFWFILGEAFIPASLEGIKEALSLSSEKARLTASTMLHNVFKTALTSNPNMKFQTVQTTICMVVILLVLSTWSRGERKKTLAMQAVYYPVCVIMYVIGMYICYVSVFSYEESVRNSTGYRYLSIVIVFGFIILSGQLLISMCSCSPKTIKAVSYSQSEGVGKASVSRLAGCRSVILCGLLCLLMICNFNSKLIYKASAFHFWENKTYKIIKETKDQIAKIEDVITDEDRVYMLSNEYSLEDMNEYPLCVALYYLDNQVSNYLEQPWKYMEDGSVAFLHKTTEGIDHFPDVLRSGNYTYIWIHSYDEFLKKKFRDMFDCEIRDTGLYEIIYNESGDIKLKLKEVI